jgi:hypothetical protein
MTSAQQETPATGDLPQEFLSGSQLATVVFSLLLGVFVVSLDTSIIGVVIPFISSHFHALDDAAWYGSAYLLAITAFQPLMGSMYKFFQVERVFQICLVIFECRTARICFLSTLSITNFVLLSSSGLDPLRYCKNLRHVYRWPCNCRHWGGWNSSGCSQHHFIDSHQGEAANVPGDCYQCLRNLRLHWPCLRWSFHYPRHLAVVLLDVR